MFQRSLTEIDIARIKFKELECLKNLAEIAVLIRDFDTAEALQKEVIQLEGECKDGFMDK